MEGMPISISHIHRPLGPEPKVSQQLVCVWSPTRLYTRTVAVSVFNGTTDTLPYQPGYYRGSCLFVNCYTRSAANKKDSSMHMQTSICHTSTCSGTLPWMEVWPAVFQALQMRCCYRACWLRGCCALSLHGPRYWNLCSNNYCWGGHTHKSISSTHNIYGMVVYMQTFSCVIVI